MKAEKIKAFALLPFLSTNNPIKGISKELMRKGSAMAIPT